MANRNEKISEILHDLGARFLSLNGNGSSLLTVTHVELTRDGKRATIFFTVFPDKHEKTALEFAKRKRSEFKEFIKDNSKLGRIPQMDFGIDSGEKNRQKIDDLLNQ
ncbi:MAG: ribosome-binding factor A [Candidatus Zambryskibacteria bacterium]|nr:ribosome-binding factor A [Candidatus Zambryskibacteria bacterium]